MPLYVGESDGGRVIKLGTGLTQITTDATESVLPVWETWDFLPTTESGDTVFRNIIVTVSYSNGYLIRVTPYMDGTALTAQDFSGSGAGTMDCQAFVAARGARLKVKVEALARTGELEMVNIRVGYKPLRLAP
jgi:hypothetical protein